MPGPQSEMPAVMRRAMDAKRRVFQEATPEELAALREWQKAWRQNSSAKTAAKKSSRRKVVQSAFEGMTPEQIASLAGVTAKTVRLVFEDYGIPTFHKERPCRVPPLDLTRAAMEAIMTFAADRDKPVKAAVVELIEALAKDGAHGARRVFHMPPQAKKGA